ncbi:unnamed protein product [Rotaria socialis]|uniref:Tc1-like transposase DDE domain-containing protein n=1 Tax=Rotaria socialis TaxID=392032 RepID=A0A818GHB6_9BILA|nr:unnamed protein product [Rotaria socialis]
MMNTNGIHLPTVNIFSCSKDHSVNSEYFLKWIETVAFHIRVDNGPRRRICIVIDNAPWHCELIDLCKPVNEIAVEFDVEIVRLPVRHCCLNPIELCWANLKDYVRKGNTRFQLTNVRELASQFITSYDGGAATKVIKRTQKIQNKFKIADRYVEENIEPMLDDEESSEESDVVSSDDE